ncbi:MAG: DUF6178 family protein [Desulfobacteraceae bacterium]|jgi:hypothetical protein
MNDITKSVQKQERERALARDRKTILSLPPEKALKAIAEYDYPVTLVQSMAEEDLYFLIHHIGPDDALPVMGRASNEQWEYLLDMEAWEQDHINSHHMTQWLNRLRKADADRFTHWIANDKPEEMTLYLFRNIELHIREYDQDPAEIDDTFFSEDQTYYIRMRPYPKEMAKQQEERDQFIKDLLNRISVYDYTLYRKFLLDSNALVPAETEEELYRLRSARLAEKGLLPFDEAVGVYQPLKAADLPNRSPKRQALKGRIIDAYPLPIEPDRPVGEANRFTRTLAQIHDGPTLDRLQGEFAALCNQVISADQKRIRDKKSLARIVQKVSGYISIGLEKAASEADKEVPYADANLLLNHLLADIFRVGYGCALALKWKTEKWHRTSWFSNEGLPIGFWGETHMGALGGLLIKKPLYFDNYVTGVLYREFACIQDIERTQDRIDRIKAFDDLLCLMNVKIGHFRSEELLTYENLILTLWANHHLNMGKEPNFPQPLTMEQFGRLFDELWQPGSQPRQISNSSREIFLGWLAERSDLTTFEISQRMAPALEWLFEKIEKELGSVKKKDLDPRFISLFLFAEDQSGLRHSPE